MIRLQYERMPALQGQPPKPDLRCWIWFRRPDNRTMRLQAPSAGPPSNTSLRTGTDVRTVTETPSNLSRRTAHASIRGSHTPSRPPSSSGGASMNRSSDSSRASAREEMDEMESTIRHQLARRGYAGRSPPTRDSQRGRSLRSRASWAERRGLSRALPNNAGNALMKSGCASSMSKS